MTFGSAATLLRRKPSIIGRCAPIERSPVVVCCSSRLLKYQRMCPRSGDRDAILGQILRQVREQLHHVVSSPGCGRRARARHAALPCAPVDAEHGVAVQHHDLAVVLRQHPRGQGADDAAADHDGAVSDELAHLNLLTTMGEWLLTEPGPWRRAGCGQIPNIRLGRISACGGSTRPATRKNALVNRPSRCAAECSREM